MKRFVIVVLILAISVAGLCAKSEIGVGANLLFTGVDAAFESKSFMADVMVGLPVIKSVINLVDYHFGDGLDSAGEPIELKLEYFLMPYLAVGGYWKVIDGKAFRLNLGLLANAVFAFNKEKGFSLGGMWGASLGLGFKFSNNCTLNITGMVPAGILLSKINEDAAAVGSFSYGNEAAGATLVAAVSGWARASFRWAL